MDQQKVGEFIADLRKAKKMTQNELGDIVGVTGKAVSRWERGLSLPDISIINNVSEALGVSTTELLNGSRLVDLETQDLDKITENTIKFYKKKLWLRFRKVILILLGIFLAVIFGLLTMFYYNNCGNVKIYNVDSNSVELNATGIITQTNDKTTIVISGFDYIGTSVLKVYSIEYEVYLNDRVIYVGGGNLDKAFDAKSRNPINMHEILNLITIYIEDNKKYDFDNFDKFYIVFKYKTINSEIVNFELPLNVERDFSNNKVKY